MNTPHPNGIRGSRVTTLSAKSLGDTLKSWLRGRGRKTERVSRPEGLEAQRAHKHFALPRAFTG